METQQFCLKWNSHQVNMLAVFEQLLSTEALVDVTLACDGLSLKAHKVVLSACSPYFQSLFVDNPCKHPIVIMKDMRYSDLKAIIDFMYKGEVNVSHDQLNALLKTAETLKVKGLAEMSGEHRLAPSTPVQQTSSSPPPATTLPVSQTRSDSPTLLSKRKHGRPRKRFRSGSTHSDEEIVPTKIKEPESPEIEELPQEADSVSDNIPPSSSKHQTPVHSSSAVNNSHLSRKSQSSRSSQQTVTEEPSDGDFSIEPSKLMEQTLTTAPVISNGLVQTSTPIGINVNTSSSLSIVPSSLSIVPASCESQLSVATDSHSSNQTQGPDSPQDVKPLLSFEEPLISIDPSQDGSSFMDSSGVPAIAGTSSSYHEDPTAALVPQESQSQETYMDVKDVLNWAKLNIFPDFYKADPLIMQKKKKDQGFSVWSKAEFQCTQLMPSRKLAQNEKDKCVLICPLCFYSTFQPRSMANHKRTHMEEWAYQCDLCKLGFASKGALGSHNKSHSKFLSCNDMKCKIKK